MIAASQDYLLQPDATRLLTPCLLVYPQYIRENIAEMIRIAGSADRLRPHVKTHKTAAITKMELEAGIAKHKCATLAEARMLAECGAPDVLLAYPLVGPAAERLAEFVVEFPNTRFSTLVDNARGLQDLEQALGHCGQQIDVCLDIDTGMHRTGIPVGSQAIRLYRQICDSPTLRPVGLHVYDGQNHQPNLAERRQAVASLMQPVLQMVATLREQAAPLPKLVCGGTPTFSVFAEMELPDPQTTIECSPGTCVLSDFNYGRDYRDLSGIRPAAVLMTRVISKQHPRQLTVDLGYKAVASDPPAGRRCHFLSLADASEVGHSEEHLVVESPDADHHQVGDILFALPAHICPTIALHSHLQVIEGGEVVDSWPVQARDRLYR